MTGLAELLHDRLDDVPVPPADLDRVEQQGRRIRRRRRAPLVVGAVVLVAVAGYALRPGGADDRSERRIDPIGRLDFGDGLRAYADPGRVVHLGDRTVPAADLEALDTDAAATPFGIVFYADGVPMLLEESGDSVPLQPGAERGDFLPTSKADSVNPWVAYGATVDGQPTVVVRDLARGTVVATHPVPGDTVIDALDDGVVFLRTGEGTTVWDPATDTESDLAGPRTSVADVRGGVVLYDGQRPSGPAAPAYRLVEGAIDAQLTFDGAHVLYWSNRLEPTDGGDPIVLDHQGTFFAVDTDGSILMAGSQRGAPGDTFYDCEVPSGTCVELGTLRMTGGDPMFIGVDM
ncbi:hypothetical protein [Nocardioides mangrovi]|uniref:WD40 repeat domain-containing protein n=1 Tax=Nocardioides mangrovi TaxID=2874580 RepID=A0ABS7UH22_9ACTN|nr:hypothetical protein [Nocardioides mangrovi]MBZ5740129.1 hypothetical protein [Nocardioides mangrovi]